MVIKKLIPFIYRHEARMIVWLIACFITGAASVKGQAVSPNDALDSATRFAYYPGLHKLEVRINDLPSEALAGRREAIAVISRRDGKKTVAKQTFTITGKSGSCMINLPKLEDGIYELIVTAGSGLSVVRSFRHKNFPWLGNNLGKTDVIYAPFEPIRIKDNVAHVVLRNYRMNGFGLWNSVQSEGKEILAAPIALHVVTDKGEASWRFTKGKWSASTKTVAVFQAEAESDPVRVRTSSTIEYDGCMKVEMDLLPGKSAEIIRHLWLEIPIKDGEASLFHYTAFESMRRNYAGKMPRGGKIVWMNQPYDQDPPRWPRGALPPIWKAEPGSDDGILWTCRDIRPWKHVISTDFVPYIWLGGGERGLAFFGANDKGYLVDANGTMQTIERRGNTVYLRVDLVNKPVAIKKSSHITFGLQASPTRPMPDNWRAKQKITPASPGPVLAWGSYLCADKYPEGYHWQVVDELVKIRETGIIDSTVFVKLDRKRAEPWKKPWGGTGKPGFDKWFALDMWFFINRAKSLHDQSDWRKIASAGVYTEEVAKILANPSWMAYTEEHASDITESEWEIFQDEWRAEWPWTKPRNEITGEQQPDNNFKYGNQAYPESYLDFCLYYHNMWFERGIGVYFDNTMPYTMYNPLLSDAYYDGNGKLQPACSIWEQRTYYKRVWQLMNKVQKKGVPYPLVFAQHITNTRLLPWNSWSSTTLDIEWEWYRDTTATVLQQPNVGNVNGQSRTNRSRPLRLPVPPDLLLAETAGRQTGSMGESLFGILGNNLGSTGIPKTYPQSEWGMRAVHELKLAGSATLNDALWKFGYGTDKAKVINYWSDNAPVSVNDPDNNKWLLLERPGDKSLFIVLQTWKKADEEITVNIDHAKLGFTPVAKAHDVATGAAVPFNGSNLKLTLPGPYGTCVIIIGAEAGK